MIRTQNNNEAARRMSKGLSFAYELFDTHVIIPQTSERHRVNYISGLALRWTRKIDTDISQCTSPLYFTGSKRVKFGIDFRPQSP